MVEVRVGETQTLMWNPAWAPYSGGTEYVDATGIDPKDLLLVPVFVDGLARFQPNSSSCDYIPVGSDGVCRTPNMMMCPSYYIAAVRRAATIAPLGVAARGCPIEVKCGSINVRFINVSARKLVSVGYRPSFEGVGISSYYQEWGYCDKEVSLEFVPVCVKSLEIRVGNTKMDVPVTVIAGGQVATEVSVPREQR
jgi:hypothetical protein